MGIRRDILRAIEAGIMGLFLIQAIRFLYGTVYSHVSSADLTRRLIDQSALVNLPGYIEYADARREVYAILIALLSPLLALLLARTRWSIPLAVSLGVVGRMLTLQAPESAALASALVVGASMFYLALIIMRRPNHFPVMLLMGVALDMIIRASNTTVDPTWDPENTVNIMGLLFEMDTLFVIIAVAMISLAGLTTINEIETRRHPEYIGEQMGSLTGWSSVALGAFFFLELTVLGLPNTVARWADVEYQVAVFPLILATLLPLVPGVRYQMGNFLGAFQGGARGPIWMLLIAFTIVLGNLFTGVLALGILVLAQFLASLTLWWLVRFNDELLPGNPTPFLMLFSLVVFALLSVGDYFTYDYAYVRDFAAPFTPLGGILRGMRDMGLPLFVLTVVLLSLPMILERRVIPWRGGREGQSFVSIILVILIGFGASSLAQEPQVVPPARANCFRVGTLNMHSGYSLLFDRNLEDVKAAIQRSGADVVLLQEVDRGRLSSFGVDQVQWLADELGMYITYVPQNEFVQGIAILSRMPVRETAGNELPSTGQQGVGMYSLLDFNGNPIYIYNVWLGFRQTDDQGVPLPEGEQDQTRQNPAVQEWITLNHSSSNFTDRLLVGGTFNFDEDSPLYEFWASRFDDPFSGRDITTLTLVDGTSVRYDYGWLLNLDVKNPNGVGLDPDIISLDDRAEMFSDHRLLVMELIINPNLDCEGQPPNDELPDINPDEADTPTEE